MNKISSLQNEIIENFELLDEWEDKYQYLLDLSNEQQSLSDQFKTENNLVTGCQSKVWIIEKEKDGLIYFESDSDAPIPKAIASVISRILSNNKAIDIVNTKINFHKATDLIHYLSPARAKGLESMINRFKGLAFKHINKKANV